MHYLQVQNVIMMEYHVQFYSVNFKKCFNFMTVNI